MPGGINSVCQAVTPVCTQGRPPGVCQGVITIVCKAANCRWTTSQWTAGGSHRWPGRPACLPSPWQPGPGGPAEKQCSWRSFICTLGLLSVNAFAWVIKPQVCTRNWNSSLGYCVSGLLRLTTRQDLSRFAFIHTRHFSWNTDVHVNLPLCSN